jgi:hypothetical protein
MQKRWWAVAAFVLIIGLAGAIGGGEDPAPAAATDKSDAKSPESETGSKSPEPATESKSPEPETESKPPEPEPEPEPEPISVKAIKMLNEFEDNELAADAKYKGETLKITGVVDSIDTDILDEDKYILRMADGGEYVFLTVNCNDMSTDELSTLKKGQKVTVIGEFDDGGDLGVEVSDCKLA